MTTLSKLRGNATDKKPPRVVVVPRGAFSETFEQRPADSCAIGLRLPPMEILAGARADAVKRASRAATGVDDKVDIDAYIETYNDAVMLNALAYACVDPNDRTQTWFGYNVQINNGQEMARLGAEDAIWGALTPEGTRLLWDALLALHVTSSPLRREASDVEVAELADRAASFARLPGNSRSQMRRLVAYVLDELRAVDPREDETMNDNLATLHLEG